MASNRWISLVFLALVILACDSKENEQFSFEDQSDGHLLLKEYTEAGGLIGEYSFIIEKDDTILDGSSRKYYPSGLLKMDGIYFNGFKEGFFSWFNPSGYLYRTGYFWHDVQIGPWFYFQDSTTKSIVPIFNDSVWHRGRKMYLLIDSIWLDKNLIGYEFYGTEGEKIYQQNYSTDFKRTYDKGYHGPALMVGSDTGLEFTHNDTLFLFLYCNNLPGHSSKHKYFIEGLFGDWLELNAAIPVNLEEIVLNEIGDFEVMATSLHRNLETGLLRSDTNRMKFSVSID